MSLKAADFMVVCHSSEPSSGPARSLVIAAGGGRDLAWPQQRVAAELLARSGGRLVHLLLPGLPHLSAGSRLPRWCRHCLAGERSPPHGLPLAGTDCRSRDQPSGRALGRAGWCCSGLKSFAPSALRSLHSSFILVSPSWQFSPPSPPLQLMPLLQLQKPRARPVLCSAPRR